MSTTNPMPLQMTRRTSWHRIAGHLRPVSFYLSMAGLLLFLLFAFALPFMVREVPAGNVGVLWKRFQGGTQTDHVMREGIQLILPWDKMVLYSARLRNLELDLDILSSGGLSIHVGVSVLYRIRADRAGLLHKFVGPDFEQVLVKPSIDSATRETVSQFTPEQLYSENRVELDAKLVNKFNHDAQTISLDGSEINEDDLLIISDIMIRSMVLPASVALAIERKTEQNHLMLEYQFRLAREDLERQRRVIEAQGLRAYEVAMPNGISQSYLILRGIEATQELAKSPNAKIVMFGSQNNDLPFVLNSMLSAPPLGAPPRAFADPAVQPPAAAGIVQVDPPIIRGQVGRAGIASPVPALLQRMNPLSPGTPVVPPPATSPQP
jgi:prohibitin 2